MSRLKGGEGEHGSPGGEAFEGGERPLPFGHGGGVLGGPGLLEPFLDELPQVEQPEGAAAV